MAIDFGIQTLRQNGTIAMDGSNKAGTFVEVLKITQEYQTPGGSRVYPDIPAGSMFLQFVEAQASRYTFTVGDDGFGRSKVTWTYNPNAYTSIGAGGTSTYSILVFARKINHSDTFGIEVGNAFAEQLLDYNYPVPQYEETIQPEAKAMRSWFTPDGLYVGNEHTFYINANGAGRGYTNRMVLVSLPDSTASDCWYACKAFIGANTVRYDNGIWTTSSIPGTLTVFRRRGNPNYIVPTIHLFALDGPVSGGNSFGIQHLKANGTLVYDSSAENVSIYDTQPLVWNEGTLPIALSSSPAVTIPYSAQQQFHPYDAPDINNNIGEWWYYLGIMQRKGSTLYKKIYQHRIDKQYDTGGFYWDSEGGVTVGNYVLSVDVSQLNPGYVNGSSFSDFYNNF